MTNTFTKTINEFIIASKFAVVGIAATAVHVFVVWVMMSFFDMMPQLANAIAFFTAFGVSYAGHLRWTFKAQVTEKNNLKRFFIIALSAFLINNILLIYMLEKAYFSEFISTVISIFIIPAYTFIASRLWAFK